MLCTRPSVRVHFDPYPKDVTRRILESSVPPGAKEELWSECVKMVINVFWGQNKCLTDLRDILASLYPKFAQPIVDGQASVEDTARLYRLLKPSLRLASSRTFLRNLEFDLCQVLPLDFLRFLPKIGRLRSESTDIPLGVIRTASTTTIPARLAHCRARSTSS